MPPESSDSLSLPPGELLLLLLLLLLLHALLLLIIAICLPYQASLVAICSFNAFDNNASELNSNSSCGSGSGSGSVATLLARAHHLYQDVWHEGPRPGLLGPSISAPHANPSVWTSMSPTDRSLPVDRRIGADSVSNVD